MKIDMSSETVRVRLEQVESLRKLCLSLASSSAGRKIAVEHPENEKVRRTSQALSR